MARAWVVLMERLGYTRYVAQGGDWGAFITEQMGVLAPKELLGLHINLPSAVPAEILKALASGDGPPPGLSADENSPNLIHYNKLDKGGHFAAWEQPQLLTEEVRVSFRPLR